MRNASTARAHDDGYVQVTERRGDDALARRRYFIIAGTRLMGAVLLILAVATLQGLTGWSRELGFALMAFGVIDLIVLPQFLVRKWRSPGP